MPDCCLRVARTKSPSGKRALDIKSFCNVSYLILYHTADTRDGNGSNKKAKADDGISILAQQLKNGHEYSLPETELRSFKLQIRQTVNTNGFTNTNLCNRDSQTSLPKCKKVRQKRRRVLKLRRQRTKETQATTRTFILVKGNQEISREYIKQHREVKPVLKALRRRIETLKARKKGGLKSSSAEATADDAASLAKFPNLYLVRSASRDAEGGKKQNVLGTAYTEVTDVRTSTPDVSPDWEILGTVHKYDAPKKAKPKHKEKLPDPHIEKVPDSYKETPLSSLPLYDDRVLKKATSGLQIFVKDSTDDEKHEKHSSHNGGVKPASSTGLHDVKTTSPGLHDVTTTSFDLNDDTTTSSESHDDTTTSSGLHDDTTTSSGLHDDTTTSSGLHDDTTTSGLHADTITSSGLHDDTITSSGLHDVKTTSSGLQVPTTSSKLHDVTSKDVTSSYITQEPSSPSETNDITSSDDGSSISIEELFNDDDSKSSAKIDRLLSDDKTTDALAKEIANLLTDEPASSSEDPKASPNDLAIITDDAPIEQKTSQQVTEVSPISAEAVSSAQKTSPLTVSRATEQCLAKRGLGPTQCSLSMICCSACCPLGEHALLSGKLVNA